MTGATERRPEEETEKSQRRASNPGLSSWVSANAGSGKTTVLTRRVLRLLFAGVPPGRILCLTFTRAAAANMASRIFADLAAWVRLDDDALTQALIKLGAIHEPLARDERHEERLRRARRLFARAVETPGGLKIQTIHAFCERLLHLFPFEANVPASFRVLEEVDAKSLLEEARRRALETAFARPERAAALRLVARELGAAGLDAALKALFAHRAIFERHGRAEAFLDAIKAKLGVAPGATAASLRDEIVGGEASVRRWLEWAAALAQGGLNDGKRAQTLRAAAALTASQAPQAASEDVREQAVETYFEVFFASNGDPRGGEERAIASKGLGKSNPRLQDELRAELLRLLPLRQALRGAEAAERSAALFAVARAVARDYAALKAERAALDFDDLVSNAASLLEKRSAEWVLYKLDASIDHILVDEAQDTSAEQWKILECLSRDWLAGRSARGERTLFAVGDEKQSIFSFQGARPHLFGEQGLDYAKRHRLARLPFANVPLQQSFRSAPRILAAVDAVIGQDRVRETLVDGRPAARHVHFHDEPEGVVEIWKPIAAEQSEPSKDWLAPLDAVRHDDPPVLLARRIARLIAQWLTPGSPERVRDAKTGAPRPIEAGDIIILVRKRRAFFEAMIRALKRARVRTAGADRLVLAEAIETMDLIVLGRALLTPDDDLALATALKSPLFGFDDADLLKIAPLRSGSLHDALAAASEARFVEAAAKFVRWREAALAKTPFDFYSWLLSGEGGRRAILSRLGEDANDALDEFLAQALAHERRRPPALLAFLDEIAASEASIKRDLEAQGDSVRVMTAHAAKGLEAPIVFLPDACGAPDDGARSAGGPRLLFPEPKAEDEPPIFLWGASRERDNPAMREFAEEARIQRLGEHFRLLYVAMTRAAERLIVAGFEGVKGRGADCWHDAVSAAVSPMADECEAPWDPRETILRFGAPWRSEAAPAASHSPPIAPPEWLFTPAAPSFAEPTLRPSIAGDGAAARTDGRLEEGRFVHELLHQLAPLKAEDRPSAAARIASAEARGLDEDLRETLVFEALAALAHPELAPFFEPGSRGEVRIAASLPRQARAPLTVNGRVDRIAVTADAVLVADFKLGRPPVGDSPQGYVTQLALYRASLAPLYPDRPIRAFLVWLSDPAPREVPPESMDAALARMLAEA